jgi:hypothetical protein
MVNNHFNHLRQSHLRKPLHTVEELQEIVQRQNNLAPLTNRWKTWSMFAVAVVLLSTCIWLYRQLSVHSTDTMRPPSSLSANANQPQSTADALVNELPSKIHQRNILQKVPLGASMARLLAQPNAESIPASIAGMVFLDCTEHEVLGIPASEVPELVTITESDSNGAIIRNTSLCAVHSTDEVMVVFNGHEYIQTKAMFIPLRTIQTTDSTSIETVRWYRPTGSLLYHLPARYRTRLLMELQMLTEIQKGCISPTEVCSSIPLGKSYFELCRQQSAQISSCTFRPNPLHSSGTCTINAIESTTVTVQLYRPTGEFVTTLIADATVQRGLTTLPVTIVGIPTGMYLATVTTPMQQVIVHQLFIE